MFCGAPFHSGYPKLPHLRSPDSVPGTGRCWATNEPNAQRPVGRASSGKYQVLRGCRSHWLEEQHVGEG